MIIQLLPLSSGHLYGNSPRDNQDDRKAANPGDALFEDKDGQYRAEKN